MAQASNSKRSPVRRGKGFARTASLLQARIRKASESRGFAETRLLTHWAEIVGEDTAAMARPVKVGYGREGFGATLTLLTTGSCAPMLQMQLGQIREKVNACYGYAAIARVRITQTAPAGFAEGQATFARTVPAASSPTPDPEIRAAAKTAAEVVADAGLRHALEALGENILTRKKQ